MCAVGNSSTESFPSLFASWVAKTSTVGAIAIFAPGWFSGDPNPLMYNVSPLITGVDFSSNDRPPTHHSRLPSRGS